MIRLGIVVVSCYAEKPRPDRNALGAVLAARAAHIAPTHLLQEPLELWPAARKAWRMLVNGGRTQGLTHGLLLQDDAVLSPGFETNVIRAIEAVPDHVLSLYNHHVITDVPPTANWFIHREVPGVAICAPIPIIEEWLAWEARWVPAEYPTDDTRWGMWAYTELKDVWFPVPALVGHDMVIRSSLGHTSYRWYGNPLAEGPIDDWTPRDVIRLKPLRWGLHNGTIARQIKGRMKMAKYTPGQ